LRLQDADIEANLKMYVEFVKPNYLLTIEPSKVYADILISTDLRTNWVRYVILIACYVR